MAGKIWADDETDILRQMAAAGKTARQISAVLKSRSIASINDKSCREGISLSRGDPEIDFEAFRKIMRTPQCV